MSKKAFQMKKSCATEELENFFVIVPTDAADKLSQFYCRICRNDVSVLTHGHFEVLRHYQGCHFLRDQRLCLEIPGLRVLDFDVELEQRKDKIRTGALVVWDREHPFTEDLIVEEAGATDPNLPLLTKVTSLLRLSQSGSKYAFVEKVWFRLVLTAANINVEVTWNRDELLVSSVSSPESFCNFPDLPCCFVSNTSS